MSFIRSMVHLKINHFIYVCYLCIFSVIVYSLSLIVIFDEESSVELKEYDDKITFWSNDYHISPINDLKYLLKPFNVQFIDQSLSSSCKTTKTCANKLRVLTSANGMNPNEFIRKKFYDYYKNNGLMNRVDAFVCFHPAAMCELFMPFNRTIIIIASTRYELGRFSADEWNKWNKNLRTIASDSRNIVAANNLYDAEYMKYFTGINTTVLPSICAYTNAFYEGSTSNLPYILVLTRSTNSFNQIFIDNLRDSIKNLNATISVEPLRKFYKFYRYSDLVRHPGIIHLPYQVSTMSIFEQYTMNIPLFFPSIDLLTEWHLKYDIVYDRTWTKVLYGYGTNCSIISSYHRNSTIPDPNNEYSYSAVHYWLKYADFYQWPHIIYFNSFDDLTLKLLHTNLTHISRQMSEYNHKKRLDILEKWKTIFERISTFSFFIKKKHSH